MLFFQKATRRGKGRIEKGKREVEIFGRESTNFNLVTKINWLFVNK